MWRWGAALVILVAMRALYLYVQGREREMEDGEVSGKRWWE